MLCNLFVTIFDDYMEIIFQTEKHLATHIHVKINRTKILRSKDQSQEILNRTNYFFGLMSQKCE